MFTTLRDLVVDRFAFQSALTHKKCDVLLVSAPMAFGHSSLSLWALAGHWQVVLAFPCFAKLSKINLGVSATVSPFLYDHFAHSGTVFYACVRFLAANFLFSFSGNSPS